MIDITSLYDAEAGLVDKAAYMDEDVYQAELEHIFGRCWLFLAHETQIPNPGDFVSAYMGEDPIIVIRDTDGRSGAFLNVCRHRGPLLCRADAGNAASFTCPYHGWTYGNDGSLISVPGYKDLYLEQLDMSQWGLGRVAQVENYKGFIFGTLDPEAPTLEEYLGPMTWWLDVLAEKREGGIEIIPGVIKWTMKTNWKFAAEQFAGDSYHSQPSHQSAVLAGFAGPARQKEGGFQVNGAMKIYHTNFGNGHGVLVANIDPIYRGSPTMATYEEQVENEVAERTRREDWTKGMWPGLGTVFPNFSRLTAPFNTLRVWHPRGPHETDVWSWTFVDKLAPPEVKEETRLFSLRSFGAAGGFEQDDGENWNLATAANLGKAARNLAMNFQMGMGSLERAENPQAWYTDRTSESNGRAFFRRWQDLMQGKSWKELAEADQTPHEFVAD